ncbi:hypothetical protein [Microbacterium timonense]|jgi:hypothetical protein|uniref:hypothetical protein n=1 Tax=Microbacterium timonense TaxID=2086576 RepID=UPI000D101950|nr:hypothetical protein [Microbacterium timonense]
MTGTPTSRGKRGALILAGVAALAVVGVLIGVGVVGSLRTQTEPRAADPSPAAPDAELRPAATPEQAYALSLPVLGDWLENDFDNAWVVTAATLEAAAATLDHAAVDDVDYAESVATFEGVVAVADAVAKGDQDAALTAFRPLLAADPGPYLDVVPDRALSRTPYQDAEERLAELDAAIAADDRAAARRASGHTAEALAEVVLAAQLDLESDAGRVLIELVPAFQAVDDVHDAVLDGGAGDAAEAAAQLRSSFDAFQEWYQAETG